MKTETFIKNMAAIAGGELGIIGDPAEISYRLLSHLMPMASREAFHQAYGAGCAIRGREAASAAPVDTGINEAFGEIRESIEAAQKIIRRQRYSYGIFSAEAEALTAMEELLDGVIEKLEATPENISEGTAEAYESFF